MHETTKVRVYKYKNIAAALAILLLIMVGISTSCNARLSKKKAKTKTDKPSSSVTDTSSDDNGGTRLTKNYTYKEVQNGTMLDSGLLAQVDGAHPFTGQLGNTEALYSFLFNDSGRQIMSASYPSEEANPEMLKNLSDMASDFAEDTGLTTLMVSGMIPDDDSPSKTDEAYMGTCADLMIYDSYYGTFDNFTGEDEYSWIVNNCYRYGFIMRGTDRVRYVGEEAALCIKFMSQSDGSASLEKLQTSIKDYSFENPMFFSGEDEAEYAAYFVPVAEDSTTTKIPIPTRDDGREMSSFISGNNDDGYIVIIGMTHNEEFDNYYENMGDDTSSEE